MTIRFLKNYKRFASGDKTDIYGPSVEKILVDSGLAVKDSMENFGVLMKKYNVKADGVTDDSTALQQAVNEAISQGWDIVIPEEVKRIKINSGITIVWPLVSLDFKGCVIDASGMTSGRAITLTGTNIPPNNRYSNTNPFKRMVLIGPGSTTTVDGIVITGDETGGSGLVPGHGALEDVYVEGFRDNLSFGPNYYISQFRNVISRKANRANAHFWGSSNAGESITFIGGSLSDATNQSGTGLGLLISSSAAETDMTFLGTSFSYNDKAFDVQCSSVNFHSPHFENKNSNPMGSCSYTSGRPGTVVLINGGSTTHGPLGTGVEPAGGRPVMFDISGDRIVFSANNIRYDGFDRNLTEFVKVLSGTPHVSINNINGVTRANNATTGTSLGRISGYTNLIPNGNFSSGNTNYWTSTLGGIVTVDSVNPNTISGSLGSTNSMKVTGSVSTGSVGQNIQVIPGTKIRVRGFVAIESISAGNVYMRARFFSDTGTLISTSGSDLCSSNATRPWLCYGGDFAVPSGARYVTVDLYVNGFTGVARITDVEVWRV